MSDKVHPAWIDRQIAKLCERKRNLAPTINALKTYSTQFFSKEDLLAGKVTFSGVVTYDQLAVSLGLTRSGAKKRMERVKELGIVSWKVIQHGVRFVVDLGSLVAPEVCLSGSPFSHPGSPELPDEVALLSSEVAPKQPPLSLLSQPKPLPGISGETPDPPGGDKEGNSKTRPKDVIEMTECQHGDLPRYCEECKGKTPPVSDETPKENSAPAPTPKQFPWNIQPWEGVDQSELERVRLYQWKYRKPTYWPGVIHSAHEFRRAFPTMQKQAEGFTVPAPKKQSMVWIGKTDCDECHGGGWIIGYGTLPNGKLSIFQSTARCECGYEVPTGSPEHAAAMEHSLNYRAAPSRPLFECDDLPDPSIGNT